MKKIIPPVDRELLKAELNPDRHLRQTNRAGNELYVVGPDAVNVIKEIGRLREIAFRNDGGGTGEALDIDKFDTDPAYGYRQLVLWDPEAEEIIGGYRFCLCDEAVYDRNGQPILTSSHMFEFSKKFLRDYLPYTLELGRSFVSVEYQSSKSGSKSLYALDNLFDGIAALGVMYKDRLKYFFGKMTIYPDYQPEAREMVMYFLKKYFGEKADLIKIRKQIKIDNQRQGLQGELQDPQDRGPEARREHPAAGEHLHEPFPVHDLLRNGHQRRVRRRPGLRHSHHVRGNVSRQDRPPRQHLPQDRLAGHQGKAKALPAQGLTC